MESAERLKQVQEYYFSQKLKEVKTFQSSGKDIINLGIGSPDLMPPEEVINELRNTSLLADAHGYMAYQGLPELRLAISEFYKSKFKVNLDPDTEVLPLMGSKEGIMHISMAYLNPGDEVLIPELGYPTYESVTKLMQATAIRYPLNENDGWMPDWFFFESLDWSRIKILWVNYPHMPTGVSADFEVLRKFVELGRSNDTLVVADNPYSFLGYNEPLSILDSDKTGLLELNSLSKTFNMAGWRVGWIGGDASVLKNVIKVKSNMDSGMFKPVQLAAVKALSVKNDWYEQIKKTYGDRRNIAEELAKKLGMECEPNQSGMFLWGKIAGEAHEKVDELLYERGVFVAPGHIFGEKGRNFLRISLCSPRENFEKAIKRML